MNNRYLFRGKREDNGEWETGFLVVERLDTSEERFYITDKMTGYHTPIIAETVGQCIDLKDKNGKLIFEGDVVKLTDTNNNIEWKAYVVFGNPYGEFNWGWNLMYIGEKTKVDTDILLWTEMEETGAYCEVIGNVYDNPELLQRSDE